MVHYEKAHYAPLKFLPGFPYVLTLFLLGLAFVLKDSLSWLKKRDGSTPPNCKNIPLLLLILAFIAVYWISFFPFFVNARARHPIVGLLFLLGAWGLFSLYTLFARGAWKRATVLAVLTALLFWVSHYEIYPYTPDKARWHYARADSWLWDGNVEDAMTEAELMLHEAYSFYMPYRIGHALAKEKQYALAERLLQAALSPDPDEQPLPYREDLYFHIGTVQAAQGKREEAKASFMQALELNPKDARAHNDLGVVLQEQELLIEALAAYEKAVTANPDFALAQSNYGHLLGVFKRHDEAIAAFQKAVALVPENPEYLYNLAIHFTAVGETAQARATYEQTLQLAPRHVRALNNLAFLKFNEGRTEEALEKLQRAIELDPAFLLARANLGNFLIESGRYEEGVTVYEETLSLFPAHIELYIKLREYALKEGDILRAESLLERARGLNLDHHSLMQLLTTRSQPVNESPLPDDREADWAED